MNGFRRTLPFVGLLFIFIGLSIFGIFFTKGTWRRDYKAWVGLGVTLIGVLLTLWGLYGRAFGPNLRYYVAYAVMAVFVIGSLVMVYLVAKNHSAEWDVTEQKLHSLHPRTIEYLQGLDRDIHIAAFPSPVEQHEIELVLERYARYSPRVQIDVRNPYKEYSFARQFGEDIALGDIFIWTGERPAGEEPASEDYREKKINAFRAEDLTESKLTNAIVEVMRPEAVKVYFLQGVGEISREPSSGGMFGESAGAQPSYSDVARMLTDDMAFEVEDLRLSNYGFVPDDCSLLVCAGAQRDLLPSEAQWIADYLNEGGRALFLLDPVQRPRVRFDQWAALLERFGVRIERDVVLEQNAISLLTGDPSMLLVSRFGSHPIVRERAAAVQMAEARTVEPLEDRPTTVTVTELMNSSRMSWAENADKWLLLRRQGGEVEIPGADRLQSHPLAVAVSARDAGEEGPSTRMVVIGDADVFENRFLPATDWLFANTVNWLVAREDLIDIPTKRRENTAIFPAQATMRTLFILFVMVFPGVVFFGGLGYVFIRRRVR